MNSLSCSHHSMIMTRILCFLIVTYSVIELYARPSKKVSDFSFPSCTMPYPFFVRETRRSWRAKKGAERAEGGTGNHWHSIELDRSSVPRLPKAFTSELGLRQSRCSRRDWNVAIPLVKTVPHFGLRSVICWQRWYVICTQALLHVWPVKSSKSHSNWKDRDKN